MRGCGGSASFCEKKKKGIYFPQTLAFKKRTRAHGLKLAAGETENQNTNCVLTENTHDLSPETEYNVSPHTIKVPLATTNGSGHFPKYQC